jgi:ubiquitin C-terminal hydrolase
MAFEFECRVCAEKWEEEKSFWDLSLPIPSSNAGCTLHDCIDAFAKREISERHFVECPKCKKQRETKKQLGVIDFPSVLILQLNRFNNDRTKIYTRIDFPLKNLDSQSFHFGKDAQPNMTASYDLFAVCCHSGEYDNGHYTAIHREVSSEIWTNFDGMRVSGMLRDEVSVLFYARSGTQFLI